jgi:hypothetical protein
MSPLLTRKHGRWLAKIIIVACFIFACIALTRQVQVAFLDYQVKTMTAQMKDLKMKPMCVGRFLIDVPADAEVSYRGAMIAGWSIATYDETDEQFAARVEKKESQLAGEKNERGRSSLESIHQVDKNGVRGKIHVFARELIPHMPAGMSGENVRIEAMIRVQKHSFNLTIEYADDKDLKELAELVTQFRSREENEIPTEAGFCFDGGFITEPITVAQKERTTMFVGLNGHPDVSIALSMIAGITTPRTLLQRDAESVTISEHRSRFHRFRRGPRAWNGEPGEEVLERVHEFNGNYGHSFMWELIHNKTDNVFTPLMSFELSTGHGQPGTTVDASLTDAEALALWDKMLSSLRVRPVVAAKPVAVAPVQVPLGTRVRANEVCPQTGWWECQDGDAGIAIVGGRQQYCRAGESMAQAVQLMPATPWQRLTGQRPTFTSKIPTPWKLVSRRQSPRSPSAATATPPAAGAVSDGADLPNAQHDTFLLPGAMVESGMGCPASGWWRCADTDAVDGARWFGRGQMLPMATLQQRLSPLKRLQGAPTVASRDAAWIFLRDDEGPKFTLEQVPDGDGTDNPA